MKIRFLKDVVVEIENPRCDERWDKNFHKWSEVLIESVYQTGGMATLKTYEGTYLVGVPADAFEQIETKKELDILK